MPLILLSGPRPPLAQTRIPINMPESKNRENSAKMPLSLLGGTLCSIRQPPRFLRAVFNEVCEGLPHREIGARTHVASKILEAATRGELSPDDLRQVGRKALSHAPTMWR
ncbi:hypothetical protein ACVIHA_004735 [Bradyrhizobium liaoningense]